MIAVLEARTTHAHLDVELLGDADEERAEANPIARCATVRVDATIFCLIPRLLGLVPMLLGLVPMFLGVGPALLSLVPRLLSLVPQLLSLFPMLLDLQ